MNTNIKTSEEFKGIVTVYLNNGHTISIPTETLIAHIEEYELNLTDFTGSEIYPAISASDWMDVNENFDAAVESYYLNVIVNKMTRLWKVEGLKLSPVDVKKTSFLWVTTIDGKRMMYISEKRKIHHSFENAKDEIRQGYLDVIKGAERILEDLKDNLAEFEKLQPKNFK